MQSIRRNILFYCLGLMLAASTASAQDSSHLRISLLTCEPGNELYSIFGHSALRVTDSIGMTDIVFNYGTFNFNEEDFYIKFMRGKLLYYLSIEEFSQFRMAYALDGRGIREQVLDLQPGEKLRMRQALIENLREDKKYYLYDFFLDNCTTRLRDLIIASKSPPPVLPATMPVTFTFRNAIHEYLDKGKQPWSKLGIDLLLGARTDRVMTIPEQQFLPDNLMKAADYCPNTRLVNSAQSYPAESTHPDSFTIYPMVFFSCLTLIMLLICRSRTPRWQYAAAGLDNFLFFMTGILGIIIILMWTATDHKMTRDNFNLLWAWPAHAAAVLLPRTGKWVKRYFLFTGCFLLLLIFAWFFLPQKMNADLLPLIALLVYLSFRRSAA